MAEERLQKILSKRGVASRRKAEELIERGKVRINGHVAKLGDKADPRRDVITVGGKKLDGPGEPFYVMLNKPRGVVTTMSDEKGRKCVAELVQDVGARVYPIGRLDRDSEGLLLLTNDGEFANALMHPSHHVPKRYRVTLRPAITDEQMLRFSEGMVLDGRKTAPAEIAVVSEGEEREDGRVVVDIVLREGRNRQIRRMCELLGLEVLRLRRVEIGGVQLGRLPNGKWRNLTGKEVKALLLAAGPKETLRTAAKYIQANR